MTVSILRHCRCLVGGRPPTGAARVTTAATTTRQLLADRAALEAAAPRQRHRAGGQPAPGVPDHRAVPGGGTTDQTTPPMSKDAGRDPTTTPTGLLPQGIRLQSAAHSTTSSNPATSGCSTTKSRSVWSSAAICRFGTAITEANLSDYIWRAGGGQRQSRARATCS